MFHLIFFGPSRVKGKRSPGLVPNVARNAEKRFSWRGRITTEALVSCEKRKDAVWAVRDGWKKIELLRLFSVFSCLYVRRELAL